LGGSIRLDPNQYCQLDSIQISPPLTKSNSIEQTGAFDRLIRSSILVIIFWYIFEH
jgi:hypothetical protein